MDRDQVVERRDLLLLDELHDGAGTAPAGDPRAPTPAGVHFFVGKQAPTATYDVLRAAYAGRCGLPRHGTGRALRIVVRGVATSSHCSTLSRGLSAVAMYAIWMSPMGTDVGCYDD